MNKRTIFILLALFFPKFLFGAMSFDGSNDYVRIADINESTTTLSVFCFVKTGDLTINKIFVSNYQLTGINGRSWFMGTANTAFGAVGNEFAVTVSSNGLSNAQSAKTYWTNIIIANNVWHHVGFTFSPGTLKLYIDGVEVATNKFVDANIQEIYNSTTSVGIGALNLESGSTNNINGIIDDVRIYSRTLTAAEVASLALSRSRTVGVPTDGLVGYWPLDGGIQGSTANGWTVLDKSGRGNHGTPTNGPTWAVSDFISY